MTILTWRLSAFHPFGVANVAHGRTRVVWGRSLLPNAHSHPFACWVQRRRTLLPEVSTTLPFRRSAGCSCPLSASCRPRQQIRTHGDAQCPARASCGQFVCGPAAAPWLGRGIPRRHQGSRPSISAHLNVRLGAQASSHTQPAPLSLGSSLPLSASVPLCRHERRTEER